MHLKYKLFYLNIKKRFTQKICSPILHVGIGYSARKLIALHTEPILVIVLITLLCMALLVLAAPLTPSATIDAEQIAPLSSATGLPKNFTCQTAPISPIAVIAEIVDHSSFRQSAPLSSGLSDNFTRQTAPLASAAILVPTAEPSIRQSTPLTSSGLPENFTRQTAPIVPIAAVLVEEVEPST